MYVPTLRDTAVAHDPSLLRGQKGLVSVHGTYRLVEHCLHPWTSALEGEWGSVACALPSIASIADLTFEHKTICVAPALFSKVQAFQHHSAMQRNHDRTCKRCGRLRSELLFSNFRID